MYSETVTIKVNGELMIIEVPCEPNMPQEKLKRLAITIYTNRLRNSLYIENNVINF